MDTGGDLLSDVHAQRHWESFEDWCWCVEGSGNGRGWEG